MGPLSVFGVDTIRALKFLRGGPPFAVAVFSFFLASWLCPATAQLLGPEFQVNSYTTSDQGLPAVAADSSGNFVVVWESASQDGSLSGIFGQRFSSAGTHLGSEFEVNSYTTSDQKFPAVAADAAGNFVVVWSSPHDGWDSGVFGQRFNAAGSPVGSEFQVNSYTSGTQYVPKVTAGSSGDFIVVWQSGGFDTTQDGSQSGVFLQRFDSAGSRIGSELQVNNFTTSIQRYPAIALDGSGNFVVVWTSYGQDGSDSGVFGRRFSSEGSPVGSEFQVNTYTTGRQRSPAVVASSLGNFVVVWESNGQDGSVSGVFGQRFNSAGIKVGSEFQVNTFTASYQDSPALAADSSGDFVVVWQSGDWHAEQDGSDSGVFGQQFNSAGSREGSEFQVNTYTSGHQFFPALAVDGLGAFAVVWQSAWLDINSQDGSGPGVFGQRLGSSNTGCVADADSLCLNNNRFHVEVNWRNYAGQTGVGQAVPFRNDSGLFWFFGPSNLEILIKVINGCDFNQRYWVYAAATTDVEYRITVTDTSADVSRQYSNTLGNRAAAITDSDAFATCGTFLGEDQSLDSALDGLERLAGKVDETVGDATTLASSRRPESPEILCAPGNSDLCLGSNRFRVGITWRDYAGHTGSGTAVPYTDDSGMFWFFGADNIEFLVKVIDGCGLNSRYWVYAAATTDVEYTMTVTDTSTDDTKTYTNPLGTASPAITDSSAFATCP